MGVLNSYSDSFIIAVLKTESNMCLKQTVIKLINYYKKCLDRHVFHLYEEGARAFKGTLMQI